MTYSTRVAVKNSHTLPTVVTAARVSRWPTTVQGWRPTSVTTQPASRATTVRAPLTATQRRNQRLAGDVAPPPPVDREPQREDQQRRPDGHHDVEGQVHRAHQVGG